VKIVERGYPWTFERRPKRQNNLENYITGRNYFFAECVDVASARILEEAGHPAIATTSAGIAYSLGYADDRLFRATKCCPWWRELRRAVRVPVTADLEAGYGTTPKAIAETVKAAIEAGNRNES